MTEGGPGTPGDVVAALRAVDGVADATITPDRRVGGAGTLHLSLLPGADEVAVATAVNRILREHFGLAVDTDNVSVVDETPARLSAVPSPQARADEPVERVEERDERRVEQVEETAPSLSADPWTRYQPSAYGTEAGQDVADIAEDPVDEDQGGGLAAPAFAEVTAESTRPWWWAAAEPATEVEPASEQAQEPEPKPDPEPEPEPDPEPNPETQNTVDLRAAEDQRGPRLLIERMQLVAADLGVQSEVTLQFGDERWTGRADGAATPTSVHRSVAVATLRAIQECVGAGMRLELEHLETPSLGADRAVVVEISMVTRRGAERLTGVSAIREDVRQAVIRATLDALNRRLESHLLSA